MQECWHVRISGRVQGVGFRYHTEQEARRLGIRGWVRNCPDGSVEALICGEQTAIATMKRWLHHGPLHASVEHAEFVEADTSNTPSGFSVSH